MLRMLGASEGRREGDEGRRECWGVKARQLLRGFSLPGPAAALWGERLLRRGGWWGVVRFWRLGRCGRRDIAIVCVERGQVGGNCAGVDYISDVLADGERLLVVVTRRLGLAQIVG